MRRLISIGIVLVGLQAPDTLAAPRTSESFRSLLESHCFNCHNGEKTKGKINLAAMVRNDAFGKDFKSWDLVMAMLRDNEMPPEEEPQPTPAQRQVMIETIRREVDRSKQAHAGDPGPVVLRRLTSAEFNYAIEDLTGLDLQLDRLIASDAVGGEGFSNVGEVQFVQDATLERYLEAAKKVAAHALIGAGPLQFVDNRGKTGQELSAIERIQAIYRKHGFRTGAGEGGEAFGLDQYPKSFYATWRYRNRARLGQPRLDLETLANQEGLHPPFVRHIWSVLTESAPSFPLHEIVRHWQQLPNPDATGSYDETSLRDGCEALYQQLNAWQTGLAANTTDDEEAIVLAESGFIPTLEHRFRVGISWSPDATHGSFNLSVQPTLSEGDRPPLVLWDRPQFSVRAPRSESRRRSSPQPLAAFLKAKESLKIGQAVHGVIPDADSFVTAGATDLQVRFPVPKGTRGGVFSVTVRLNVTEGADCLVRCTVSDGLVAGETVASTGASAVLLADPTSPQLETWQEGIRHFARNLPQVSHREPAPSDRDPIPAPYNNNYNNAERNQFHYVIKYHREDRFLTEHLVDAQTRRALDVAWIDLLSSFDYHDTFYQFVGRKYQLKDESLEMVGLSQGIINAIPAEPRRFIQRLFDDYQSGRSALQAAESDHLDQAIAFARRAWRRPLSTDETDQLKRFYFALRSTDTHQGALRGLLSRILVSPAFLYRLETVDDKTSVVPTPPLELATRLSFFLWASIPDPILVDLALSGALAEQETLRAQVERLLRHPKSKRFATEFFGQWLGFYQFDRYQGVDTNRFPDFDDSLKSDMYDEAKSFFESIVRENRPIGELIFADYGYMTPRLATHYGISSEREGLQRVDQLNAHHRGGLLQLGAILTSTSAPLRTSAVKRGDWILRRILGTPVPPPPADAGSIPADDVLADGLTVRARLEAHRQDPTCANCHNRIDPLGFALEHFDPVGRWRETYRDGQLIDDSGRLASGKTIDGLEGLHAYLRENESIFRRNLTTKLLGYALGRSQIVSDQALVEKLVAETHLDTPFAELVLKIVASQQFQSKRGTGERPANRELETSVNQANLTL